MAKGWVLLTLCFSTVALATTATADGTKPRRTEIRASPNAKGKTAKELEKLAEQFSSLSPQPDERIAYFKWLDKPGARFVIDHWQCSIEEVARRDGKDAWLVKILVSPILNAGGVCTLDTFLEEYEYSSGKFRFVGGRAGEPGVMRRYITFN